LKFSWSFIWLVSSIMNSSKISSLSTCNMGAWYLGTLTLHSKDPSFHYLPCCVPL
jgi:hypothetical protein